MKSKVNNKPRVSRFNSLSVALHYMRTANAGYAVLMGDDMTYWVPDTNRETGRLIQSGYEITATVTGVTIG